MGAVDISVFGLLSGLLLVVIPIVFLYRYRTGLVWDTLIAVGRMMVQLFLIAIYLTYLFEWNSTWVNLLWVAVMVLISSYTALKRSRIRMGVLLAAVFASFGLSVLVIMPYFLGVVVGLDDIFEARYFVPITGMLLGNMLTANVVAMSAYQSSLKRDATFYRYLLGNGATRSEALMPFVREGLMKAANPTIASMAVMGLISLPGTMTGQIIGGSDPSVAIKYQIMIMVVIFSSSLVSVMLSLWFIRVFDKKESVG